MCPKSDNHEMVFFFFIPQRHENLAFKSERIAFSRLAESYALHNGVHVMDFLRAISLFPDSYIFSLSCDTELVYPLNGNIHAQLDVTFSRVERFVAISSAYTCFRNAFCYDLSHAIEIWMLGKFAS
jgi:hypothetical protein